MLSASQSDMRTMYARYDRINSVAICFRFTKARYAPSVRPYPLSPVPYILNKKEPNGSFCLEYKLHKKHIGNCADYYAKECVAFPYVEGGNDNAAD